MVLKLGVLGRQVGQAGRLEVRLIAEAVTDIDGVRRPKETLSTSADVVGVDDCEHAAGTERSGAFVEADGRVKPMEGSGGADAVEGLRRERPVLERGGDDPGRREADEVLARDSSEVRAELDRDQLGTGAAQLDAQLAGPGTDLKHFGTRPDPYRVDDQSHDGRRVCSAPGVVEVGHRVERLSATLRIPAHPAPDRLIESATTEKTTAQDSPAKPAPPSPVHTEFTARPARLTRDRGELAGRRAETLHDHGIRSRLYQFTVASCRVVES